MSDGGQSLRPESVPRLIEVRSVARAVGRGLDCRNLDKRPAGRCMRLSESPVAIVGLGLMGGSLAMALRGQCARLVGVARPGGGGSAAIRQGMVDAAVRPAGRSARGRHSSACHPCPPHHLRRSQR